MQSKCLCLTKFDFTQNQFETYLSKFTVPSWHNYFLELSYAVALRSTCISRQVGSVIVKNRKIISTGYNGTPPGMLNCNRHGCKVCDDPLKLSGSKYNTDCICVHAEANAVLQSHSKSLEDASIYVTTKPCNACLLIIIRAGIKHVYYSENYDSDYGDLQAALDSKFNKLKYL